MHEAMPAKGALKPGLSQDPADAKDDKWFVRPHHVESLTMHERSMKDDVTNTRYYSHVNQDHGKVPEVNWCEEAMGHIEQQLAELKDKQSGMAFQQGKDLEDEIDKLKDLVEQEASERTENFMNNKKKNTEGEEKLVLLM